MKWDRNQLAETAASVGAACLIAGYLRYAIQSELLLTSKILLIAGGVLLLGGVLLGFGAILKFFSKRSSQLGTNTAILALAVIAILGFLNYLGFKHHKRFDLTSEKLFTLSDQTRKIVGGLSSDVTIVRFAKLPDAQISDLMAEYKNLSSHLKFQNVDPDEKPDVAKEYGATQMGDVVVASGSRREHLEPGPEGGLSEEDITSTILKVTREKVKTVCFVTGHGEKSLDDDSGLGYAAVAQGLKRETYSTETINLIEKNGVPTKCSVLVIAGPTKAFFPQEVAMVAKYLDGGGKALVGIDPDMDPKLDEIFKSWNISVGNNVVIDASGMGQQLGAGPEIPLVGNYGESPITKKLQHLMTYFPVARTVSTADKSKSDPQTVELLKTSSASFTKPKLEHTVKFNPKTDTRGPLSLGVAASRSADEKNGRLVVVGDSDFATNQVLNGPGSDGDFFFNTINWLAEDENMISIRPKSATNRRVTLTAAQGLILNWVDQFLLPGIVILLGVAIWWKRR
ncbi:MAG: GldG family protein [Acidobacteriia bacterium]|nr:GldG family protein [Terriglobia bacterium]